LALYDDIGHDYDRTRKVDSFILNKFIEHLNANESNHYLEIGCGTGNYLIGMIERGYTNIVGLDPSELMLNQAREKCRIKDIKREPNSWIRCYAENTPFLSDSFDGVFCIHALHHFAKGKRASIFNLVFHILRNGGRFVIFTNTHDQIDRYWLNYYFPKAMNTLKRYTPDMKVLIPELEVAGFKIIKNEPYYISENLNDLFLYSKKHEPKAYLEESFRNNMSLFKVKATDREEIKKGLKLLKADCSTGKIYNIINKFEYNDTNLGDYLFIVCEK